MAITKLYEAPTITYHAHHHVTARRAQERESMPMGSFASEVVAEVIRRSDRNSAQASVSPAVPPPEKPIPVGIITQTQSAAWGDGVEHGDASYMLAPRNYQALTGSKRQTYQKARSEGCYILRRAFGDAAYSPVFYKNLSGLTINVFVKAVGLRVIGTRLEYMNRSASGVETTHRMWGIPGLWHEGLGRTLPE
jgi:hypothetical protein